MGIFSPLRTWVDEFIPYYMEIMGVDRPDRTHKWVGTFIPYIPTHLRNEKKNGLTFHEILVV